MTKEETLTSKYGTLMTLGHLAQELHRSTCHGQPCCATACHGQAHKRQPVPMAHGTDEGLDGGNAVH